MLIEIPVSVAEFFDKISILEIKFENIIDQNKRNNISQELNLLKSKLNDGKLKDFLSNSLYIDLKNNNIDLWNIFDDLRKLESQNKLDDEYAKISEIRDIKNDERAKIKQKINEFFNSDIFEVKEYQ